MYHPSSLMRVLTILWTVSVFTVSSQTTSLDCEITITVNKNSTSSDWRAQYNTFGQGTNKTISLEFGNLQEVLSALNTTIFHGDSGCIEVILSAGSYSIERSVYLLQNIRIVAEHIGSVFVEFSNLPAPQNVSVFYAVTIFGAQFVEIRGINFSQSLGIIAIEKVTNVTISDCSFMFFSRGAVDIYQSFLVQVHDCSFDSNGFEGVVKPDYQYRGHAGGLSIGFDDNHYNANGTDPNSVPNNRGIFITHCVFTNNTSDPREVVSTSELLQSFIFTGRGGAIAITVNTSFSLNAIVTDCVMDNNSALSFCGGLYLGYSGYAAHTSTIDRTLFIRNRCAGPSGGLQLGFLEGADNGFTVRLKLLNSVFQENRAEYGGAIHLFANQSSSRDGAPQLSQVAYVENCTFTRNYAEEFGAAMCLNSLLFLVDTSSVEPLIVVNCTFSENFGGRAGVLSTAYLPLAFYGGNTFSNNSGRVLIISGTRAEIHGSLQFTSNYGSGLESGSLYITSFGQLQLFSGADVAFTNNSGIVGASIVVQDILGFVTAFSKILYNPLCVLRYENETAKPRDWENVKISFSGNQAFVASAVFHNNIDLCSWIGFGPQFFDRKEVFQWEFVSFSNDSVNSAHSIDEKNPLWYVQTQAESLRADTPNVTAYPGQEFAVSMTGSDEYGLPIIVSVRLTDTTGEVDFSPAAATPDAVDAPSIVTQFSVANNTAILPVSKTIQVTSIVTNTPLVVNITLRPLSCPVGHMLKQTDSSVGQSSMCACNDEGNDHIMNCQQETLRLSNGRWGVSGIEEGETGDRLVTYTCPQHFCQCLRVTNTSLELTCSFLFNPKWPNEQCICGRQGVLCGECSDEGAGVSALLSNCKTCGTVSLLYIIALLILDVLVIGGFLLFFKWSIYDWLFPALFYLQVIPFLTFHFPVTFEVVHPYVYYVSSGLSFYFIYDFCLGPQLSALLVYFIRFIPPLVLIITACPVAIVRHCSHKKTAAPWSGLWLVALLLSTHTIHTSMSVLNCPSLPGHNGAVSQRWYMNGNIECFTNGHVPLALLSLAMLLLFLVLLPVAIVYTTQCSKRHIYWLYNAVSSSSEAYKSEYAWWGAVELLRRGLLIVLAVALPGKEYWVIFSFSIIFGLYSFFQPYKSRSANIIETLLATNMMVLLLIRSIDVYNSDIPQTYIVLKDYTADDCIDSAVHTITVSSIFLLPGYCFPLAVFIIASMASAIFALRSCCAKTKKSSADDSSIPLDAYRLMNEEGSISTTSVSTDDDLQVPLSRMLDNIYINGRKPEFHSSVTVVRNREPKTTFQSRNRTVST